ncbi:uncharacterized protein BT62DRAFT_97790 [Guyanagaster necrorhizus]|uniref:Uncharacterized protein n=1 Tax=Guyanagaster necrorhizus TaxID=856835 RepID=A0A9P7VUM4_9AGAR|nr:uncharacterized protein BT62DRAFT_97790 [Guyanagaster necrorhizus MCA 3950]KAG7447025.1 hypothetical protein BT62DRAFT_97790 [Guyanagaster necrorhizus MCA 3950]
MPVSSSVMPLFAPLIIHGTSKASSNNTVFDVQNPYTSSVVGMTASAIFHNVAQMLQTPEYNEVIALSQIKTGANGTAVSNWQIAYAFIYSIVSFCH